MVITDVPQSGIYYQQGAVVQLVVQLVDIVTGLPINLGAASGMSLSLLYPDGVTSQTFQASLYTDGSDGMISYITKNSGSNVDMSQSGLYQMQGSAVIGGIALPPSYFTDFYVLKNASGMSVQPVFNSSALIMFDSNSARWAVTVNTSGVFVFSLQPTGPSNFLMFNNLVMKDSDGIYWTVTISTSGAFVTTQGGAFADAVNLFFLTDSSNRSWIITISTAGVLGAA